MSRGLGSILAAGIAALVFAGFAVNGEDVAAESSDLEARGQAFLDRLNAINLDWFRRKTLTDWAYETNITQANLDAVVEFLSDLADYNRNETAEVDAFPWRDITNETMKREFAIYAKHGTDILPAEEYEELSRVLGNMSTIYNTATVCDYRNRTKCDLALSPDLADIFIASRDPEELKYYWIEWRKASGGKIRPVYPRYVELSNKAARLSNYTDNADNWISVYETANFTDQIDNLWAQIRPLYVQLHAYVRNRLVLEYGEDIVSREGPIPAHLLGNIWAQEWQYVANFSSPYPGKKRPDPTVNMVAQGYDAERIFRLADSFYTSLDLLPVPDTFWNRSLLADPNDGRDVVCQGSAWNFFDGEDYRIKMCTRINYEDLLVAHHEMGHIQYYMQFKNQPAIFLDNANPGFGEAVGDSMALSVSTTRHLKKIELLDEDVVEDGEEDLNYLYEKALEWVTLIPFALTLDQWRWRVFRGEITTDNYNSEWWRLANDYQGIEPPVERSEEDLDPAAKYHVAANVEYLRYFIGIVLQYQFYDTLCKVSGQYDPNNSTAAPLYKCDIYESAAAGERLGSMLRLGRSKPWPDALEVMTGQREMDASGLLNFFNPLYEWLEAKNNETGVHVGWPDSTILGNVTMEEKKRKRTRNRLGIGKRRKRLKERTKHGRAPNCGST